MARKAGRGRKRSRRNYFGRKRHTSRRSHVRHVSVTDTGGSAAAAYAYAVEPQAGYALYQRPLSTGMANTLYAAKESIPLYGQDPDFANARTGVESGAVLIIAGRAAEWLGLRSPRIHLGKRLIVKLWGKAR